MLAATVTAPGALAVTEVAVPEPGPGEVLVEVALTGICATDVHIVDGHFPTARYPLVLGHEVTGTIVAAGPGATGPGVGANVVLDPGMPCGACRSCRRGRPNLCEHREAIGITHAGGAARYVLAPA